MNTFLAGEAISVPVPLTRNGEPFVPADGDVFWELRGHNGAVLSPKTVLHGVTDSVAEIPVGAVHNALGAGRQIEKRTIIVTGLVDGVPFNIRLSYRLTEFLNFTASPRDVRRFIGVDEGELPDDEIDLVEAFFDMADRSSYAQLVAAFEGEKDRVTNRGLVAQAVLNILPGLPARLSKSESDGTSKADRFDIDFAELERKALSQLTKALTAVTTSDSVTPTLVVLTQRTDPLTGE